MMVLTEPRNRAGSKAWAQTHGGGKPGMGMGS